MMKFTILIAVLLPLLCYSVGNQLHLDLLKMVVDNSTILPWQGLNQGSSANISCTCDARTIQQEVPIDILTKNYEAIAFFEYCKKNNLAVCDFSRRCDDCTLEIKECAGLSQTEPMSSQCFYRTLNIQRDFPRRKLMLRSIEGHRNDSFIKTKIGGPFRNRRDLNSGDCVYPTEMRTAELKCYIYSKYIKCRQYCLYGYTLQEGISTEMKCYFKENKWSGHGFRECVPFVDCTLTLATGGKITCMKNTVWTAPHCNVSCYAYEDKPSIPMKTYTCTLDPYKWKPDLPHCVIAGSGFVLAPPPRIKDHSKESFEDETKRKKSRPSRVIEPKYHRANYDTEDMWG